jgi:tetratricopeptide (TPR) repeat protein
MTALSSTTPDFNHELSAAPPQSLAFPSVLDTPTQNLLLRMFRDPYLLETTEKTDLIAQLREAVAIEPAVSELRILFGMALCVNFEAQEALEQLREGVRLSPDSFIAHLKFGELLMRLRIVDQAAEETQLAAELAVSPMQSDLARRQASAIRAMKQAGIERGGYGKVLSMFSAPFSGVRRMISRSRQQNAALAR